MVAKRQSWPGGRKGDLSGPEFVEAAGFKSIDAVVGVASYSQDSQSVLYRNEAATASYTREAVLEILDHIRLETIGVPAVESLHDGDLRAFARLYDGLNVVAVPVSDTAGVVVACDPDADGTVHDAVDAVEAGLAGVDDDH
jgi:hypothetical protein